MKRRVVITGMGTINPLGNSVADAWKNVRANACGIGPITSFDTTDFPVKLAGEVKDFTPDDTIGKKEAKRMARFTQLAVAAAVEAVDDSGIDFEKEDTNRCGVLVSSGIGGLPTIEEEHKRGMEKGFNRVSPFFIPMAISNMSAGQIAIRFGLHGMCSCVVTACAGGNNAIGDAFRHVRDGYADVMVCGGSESCISELGVGGFASLKALNTTDDVTRASIPFDKERDGFVIAEGAGILVIEELEHALARGAKIYAEIVGFATNTDGTHITNPNKDMMAEVMRQSLNNAGISANEIGYVNAHGTGTINGDIAESLATEMIFGTNIPISSIKSYTGHTLGACGAIEAILSIEMMNKKWFAPTLNLNNVDENCGQLDYITKEGRIIDTEYVMTNNFAFGGINTSIILKRV